MLIRKTWTIPMNESQYFAKQHKEAVEAGWFVQHIYIKGDGSNRFIVMEGLRDETVTETVIGLVIETEKT